jgi:hypothetical protein
LTFHSKSLTDILVNVDYLKALFELTFTNTPDLLDTVLCVFGNIIAQQEDTYVIDNFPFLFRLKEIFIKFKANGMIRKDITWLINLILKTCRGDDWKLRFVDIISEMISYYTLNKNISDMNEYTWLMNALLNYTRISDEVINLNPLPLCYYILKSCPKVRIKIVDLKFLTNIYYTENLSDNCLTDEYIEVLRSMFELLTINEIPKPFDEPFCANLIWVISNICCHDTFLEKIYRTDIPDIILTITTQEPEILFHIISFIQICFDMSSDYCKIKLLNINNLFDIFVFILSAELGDKKLLGVALSTLRQVVDYTCQDHEIFLRLVEEIICVSDYIEKCAANEDDKISADAGYIGSILTSFINSKENEF